MATISKQRLGLAIGLPTLIFISCFFITLSTKFKEHSNAISIGILLDMLLVAPLLYLFVIRKTNVSKLSVLRVFTVGLLIATYLLSQNQTALLDFIKTWVAPFVELFVIGAIAWKFYKAKQLSKNLRQNYPDFLIYCRQILGATLGSEKVGNMMASEVAVFYYLFSRQSKNVKGNIYFTSHKENGIVLVLCTFLFILLLETVVMHFVFDLWNHTLAWVLTGLSVYTCLQLLAHIRAIYSRPTIMTYDQLLLRNGLMGGDVTIDVDKIERIEQSSKDIGNNGAVSMAFIKGIENHNMIIHLKDNVEVTKAFGIKKTAKVILLNIDEPKQFIETIHQMLFPK